MLLSEMKSMEKLVVNQDRRERRDPRVTEHLLGAREEYESDEIGNEDIDENDDIEDDPN